MTPICSNCIYLTNKPERSRRCPRIPIFHRDMLCANENNMVKDHVSGEEYKPYCEEVNRHAECLEYYPKGLEAPIIVKPYDLDVIGVAGHSPLIVTTDGTEPNKKMATVGDFDEEQGFYSYDTKIDHTCTIKAACILDDVLSGITENFVEVSDTPTIEFDRDTNTVTINSYNKVYYTTDGSKVTEESPVYEGPFVISQNTTVKCRSYANEDFSDEVTLVCVSVEPPVIDFDPNTKTVSIIADDPILYSTDGSDIYDDSEEYKQPFVIDKNTVVKAACLVGENLSEQAELECKVPTIPEITYEPRTHVVTITSDNTVLYTTDGSDVKKKDTEYTGPFKITEPCMIKAISIVEGRVSEQAEYEVEVV